MNDTGTLEGNSDLQSRHRRRIIGLVVVVILLLLMMAGMSAVLANLLKTPIANVVEDSEAGVKYRWVRSIYGVGAAQPEMLQSPVELAVSDNGLIYVSQPTISTVYGFNEGGGLEETVSIPDSLVAPSALAAGPGGRLFVADKASGQVFCLSEDREILWEAAANLVGDMAWIGDRLYVAQHDSVLVLDIDGNELFRWGERGSGEGQLDFPRGLAESDGNLIISDGHNARLQAFTLDGKFLWSTNLSRRAVKGAEETTSTDNFQVAGGIAVAPEGQLISTDPLMFRIPVFEPDGTLIAHLASEGEKDGLFYFPSAIASLGDDRYVIADTGNNRLQIVEITFNQRDENILRNLVSGINAAWCALPISILLALMVAITAALSLRRGNRDAVEE